MGFCCQLSTAGLSGVFGAQKVGEDILSLDLFYGLFLGFVYCEILDRGGFDK